MKPAFESIFLHIPHRAIAVLFAAIMLFSFSISTRAQNAQLTLADLLIGLRSKKVSIDERNNILTEAVVVRGVTFSLTPEIEKELSSTGAKTTLLDSIRKRSTVVKVSNVSNSEPKPAPPPDFSFYEKRAASELLSGNVDAAVADYSKAIELNAAASSSYLGRGGIYSKNGSFDLAISDFGKVLETMPNNTSAIAGRAAAYEAKGKLELSKDDFTRLVELEPDNQAAKSNLARVQTELNKILEAQKPKPEPPAVETKVKPEFLNVGSLTEANAIRMVMPVYSTIASRSNIGGKVVVEVVLDEEGKVKSAKAIAGHQMLRNECESAALRSQFKPQTWEGQPIGAKGTIIYNFVPKR